MRWNNLQIFRYPNNPNMQWIIDFLSIQQNCLYSMVASSIQINRYEILLRACIKYLNILRWTKLFAAGVHQISKYLNMGWNICCRRASNTCWCLTRGTTCWTGSRRSLRAFGQGENIVKIFFIIVKWEYC